MNILPLILALALMLSILTIERLDKFKNQSAVQREYQIFLKESERVVFNQRQRKLFKDYDKDIRQLSFRFFIDKKARDRDENVSKQFRKLNIELMKILYSDAPFFQKMKENRGDPDVFLGQLLDAVQRAAEAAPPKLIKRIEDIARLNLNDEELQKTFYHMLKGTTLRKKEEESSSNEKVSESPSPKSYLSLLNFINDEGSNKTPTIVIQYAPKEILLALFEKEDIVENIISKRTELAKTEGDKTSFATEFKGKIRAGIDEKLLDFTIKKNKENFVYD